MKTGLLIAGLAAAGVLAALVFAADAKDATFDSLDKDRDGVITASEARANPAVAARFAAADKNQDGYLSREEFAQLRGQ